MLLSCHRRRQAVLVGAVFTLLFVDAVAAQRLGVAPSPIEQHAGQVMALFQQQQFDKVCAEGDRYVALCEKEGVAPDPVVTLRLTLAHMEMSRFERAEEVGQLTHRLIAARYGQTHEGCAAILFNLSMIAYRTYRNDEAYGRASRSYQIVMHHKGRQSPELANAVDVMGMIHERRGEVGQAEQHLLHALALRRNGLGSSHPELLKSYGTISGFYSRKGAYEESNKYLDAALGLAQRTYGPQHPHVAKLLAARGLNCKHVGDYENAIQLYTQAIEIRKRVFADKGAELAQSYHLLAALLAEIGRYDEAERINTEALRLSTEHFGADHPENYVHLNNMAWIRLMQKKYAEADTLLNRARLLRVKHDGAGHPDVANIDATRGLLMALRGRAALGVPLMERAMDVYDEAAADMMGAGSEQEKLQFLKLIIGKTHAAVGMHMQYGPDSQRAAQLALRTILRRKGRVEDAVSGMMDALRDKLDERGKEVFDEYVLLRAELARRGFTSATTAVTIDNAQQMQRLRTKTEALERQLNAMNRAFGSATRDVEIADVARGVPADGVPLEFYRFRPFQPDTPRAMWDQLPQRYVVYAVTRSGKVTWADLGDSNVIDRLVLEHRQALMNEDDAKTKVAAEKLHDHLIAPIVSDLNGAVRLLISPDGLLNVLPFAALVGKDGKYLLETHHVSYLSSGRDLTQLQPDSPRKAEVLIVANPDYAADLRPRDDKRPRSSKPTTVHTPLPGTAVEAQAIGKLLPDAKQLVGREAREDTLKAYKQMPGVLHIATHGFFLPDQRMEMVCIPRLFGGQTTFVRAADPVNPLSRAGIVLAGADHGASGNDDGILTAMELTGFDMADTQLVVLSACETALGDVLAGEGVYGLRRALVIAGAQTQVISLWPVSDEATALLMTLYYQKLTEGLGRVDAMREAQRTLMQGKFNKPVFWAPFIVSGDWRRVVLK